MLTDCRIEIVLNLTRPKDHYGISLAALKAGKNVYSEKPICLSLDEGMLLLDAAEKSHATICCAPDTFLGSGGQTCRKIIDSGLIGKPLGASSFMVSRGYELWHPNPEFYYKRGAGPMMDMGPYYLSAMVNLIGGIKEVCGMSKMSFPERVIKSKPNEGSVIDVEVDTHMLGLFEFESAS
jgi:predicted dehydrogenase